MKADEPKKSNYVPLST